MNAVMRNSAIAAKISCMSSKLLTLEDYASMAELKNVSQVAAYLKNNTHYGAILDSVNESDVHREPLEILLKTTIVDDFEKLYCFADCSLKGFLDKILMFYEVEAIEHVAHSVYNKNCADDMLGEFLKRHIDVDLEILSSATTLDEFAESLGNTQYYKAFSSIVKSRGALSVFDIETALNIYCYTAVMKSIQNIPKEEQEKGLISYTLTSYQGNTLYFRKTYDQPVYNGYYAKSFNGYVVILNGDEKTVYEYTQIPIHLLPDDIRSSVMSGYYLENETDLYNFLENYSS